MNAGVPLSASETLKTLDEALTISKHALDTAVYASNQMTTTGYEQAVHSTREQMDAMARSGAIWLDGFQALTRTWLSLTSQAMDQSIAQSKATSSVKSIHQLVQLSRDFTQANLERTVADAATLAEQSMKVAEAAAKPLAEHLSPALQQMLSSQAH